MRETYKSFVLRILAKIYGKDRDEAVCLIVEEFEQNQLYFIDSETILFICALSDGVYSYIENWNKNINEINTLKKQKSILLSSINSKEHDSDDYELKEKISSIDKNVRKVEQKVRSSHTPSTIMGGIDMANCFNEILKDLSNADQLFLIDDNEDMKSAIIKFYENKRL